MSNGYGTGVIVSLSGVAAANLGTGSITSLQLNKQTEMKEVTDGNDNFVYVAFPKQKKVGTVTMLFTGSGSAFALPQPGVATTTLTVPWSSDASGNWGITKSSVKASADSWVEFDFEITQWITSVGTLP